MKKLIDFSRWGKFYVSHELIHNISHADVNLIFKDVVILRCEYMAITNEFEYYAVSKHFRVAEQAREVPKYIATVKQDEKSKIVKITWEEVTRKEWL